MNSNPYRIVPHLEKRRWTDQSGREWEEITWTGWRCLDCNHVQMTDYAVSSIAHHPQHWCPAAPHPMYAAASAADPRRVVTWVDHFPLAPWYLKKDVDRLPSYDDLERICQYVRTHPMPWLPAVVQLVPLDDPPEHDRWADDGGA